MIDDENETMNASDPNAGEKEVQEEVESEEAYSAADLAQFSGADVQTVQKGFFATVPGYLTIAAIALLILAALLFFLFFGVIVLGEVEEHDDVFELCAIRLMKRREGKWCVDLGSVFDDNAVVKLRIGLIFAVMFDGWDIEGNVTGMYEGVTEEEIAQPVLMYRKKIRRSV